MLSGQDYNYCNSARFRVQRVALAVLLILSGGLSPSATAVELRTDTTEAFDRYVQRFEAERRQGPFLRMDQRTDIRAAVENGEILVRPARDVGNNGETSAPHGLIHHWYGAMLIPGATLPQVRAILQDYAGYQKVYAPDVMASRLIRRQGDSFDIFLRLYKRQVLTVTMNSEYHVEYSTPNPRQMTVRSVSTRIREVEDPAQPEGAEKAAADQNGFLWRLNSYWRFQETPRGVYAECEAVSLSRSVPFGLQVIAGPFIENFPRESLQHTMNDTRKAVTGRSQREGQDR